MVGHPPNSKVLYSKIDLDNDKVQQLFVCDVGHEYAHAEKKEDRYLIYSDCSHGRWNIPDNMACTLCKFVRRNWVLACEGWPYPIGGKDIS